MANKRSEIDNAIDGIFVRRITLILTNRCNLNCEYCISRPERGRGRDLETKEAMKVIDFADSRQKGRRPIISITGGEPSLHKDFMEIVRCAASNGKVEVVSNGSFIPTDPTKFAEKMKPFLGPDGNLNKNIKFRISADPVHFEMDKKLKDRLFLLANFIERHREYSRNEYLQDYLQVSVRGNFKMAVMDILQDTKGLSQKTTSALRGVTNLSGYVGIVPAESIVRVAGAKGYVPSIPDIAVRDFDLEKEAVAGFKSLDICVNPEGNAFGSVYSSYENLYHSKGGKRHWMTFLGNTKEHGMKGILESFVYRKLLLPSSARPPNLKRMPGILAHPSHKGVREMINREYKKYKQVLRK